MMMETEENEKEHALFYYMLFKKAWHQVRIDLQQFWPEKSLSLTQDLNLACPDRMPLLYRLCHHHLQGGRLAVKDVANKISRRGDTGDRRLTTKV